MLTWIEEDPKFLGQDAQPITPATFPTSPPAQTSPPTGWPSAVPYPPPKPAWWPDGLAYPPIGDSWATTAPSWWTLGNQAGNLPNWPPPKPDGWPSFPWPVPPASVQGKLPCASVCAAQFGDKGTAPNSQALLACNVGCGLAPGGQQPGGTFRVPPQATSPALTPPAKKTSSAAPILIVLGLVAVGALVVSLSGPGTSVRV